MTTQILGIRRYKVGYEIRRELHDGAPYVCDDFETKIAYTPEGHYIGSSRLAHRLCSVWGIKPELKDPDSDSNVCSIGFCEKEQKWFGWSHRAMWGFGIGDVVKEGDCAASSGWIDEYLEEHPEADRSLPVGFVAKTLDDCKTIAIAFADSVS